MGKQASETGGGVGFEKSAGFGGGELPERAAHGGRCQWVDVWMLCFFGSDEVVQELSSVCWRLGALRLGTNWGAGESKLSKCSSFSFCRVKCSLLSLIHLGLH
jgi:hypothetical protein